MAGDPLPTFPSPLSVAEALRSPRPPAPKRKEASPPPPPVRLRHACCPRLKLSVATSARNSTPPASGQGGQVSEERQDVRCGGGSSTLLIQRSGETPQRRDRNGHTHTHTHADTQTHTHTHTHTHTYRCTHTPFCLEHENTEEERQRKAAHPHIHTLPLPHNPPLLSTDRS